MSCYRKNINGVSLAEGDQICSVLVQSDNFAPCCDLSHGATCVASGLCYQPAWIRENGDGSGWLTATCSDEMYNSGACNRHCTSQPNPDVVYNNITGLWACCGETNNAPDCNNPTDETFQAPAPDVLLGLRAPDTTFTTSTSSTRSATSIATSATSATTSQPPTRSASSAVSTASSSNDDRSGSSLSTGAKAGVGVGVALVALIIIGILAFFFVRSRRRRKAQQRQSLLPPPTETRRSELMGSAVPSPYPVDKKHTFSPVELHSAQEERRHEME